MMDDSNKLSHTTMGPCWHAVTLGAELGRAHGGTADVAESLGSFTLAAPHICH